MTSNIRALLASIVVGGAVAAGLIGSPIADATPMPEVCTGIDNSITIGEGYRGYLIDAYAWGQAFNWDQHQQAHNITDSVIIYCPWHRSGIIQAAEAIIS